MYISYMYSPLYQRGHILGVEFNFTRIILLIYTFVEDIPWAIIIFCDSDMIFQLCTYVAVTKYLSGLSFLLAVHSKKTGNIPIVSSLEPT
jgi:hypothetical protein